MIGQWIKKSQHLKKFHFTTIKTKTLIGFWYGKKVDFII